MHPTPTVSDAVAPDAMSWRSCARRIWRSLSGRPTRVEPPCCSLLSPLVSLGLPRTRQVRSNTIGPLGLEPTDLRRSCYNHSPGQKPVNFSSNPDFPAQGGCDAGTEILDRFHEL